MRPSVFSAAVAQVIIGLPTALACLGYTGGLPVATRSISNSAVIEVAAGQVFDGGWAKYDRGNGACNGQAEGTAKDAVFLLHAGATLRNVIIGKHQAEGVHCKGHCNLEFVWFEDVCEDAISIVSINKSSKPAFPTYILTRFIEGGQAGRSELHYRGRGIPRK